MSRLEAVYDFGRYSVELAEQFYGRKFEDETGFWDNMNDRQVLRLIVIAQKYSKYIPSEQLQK